MEITEEQRNVDTTEPDVDEDDKSTLEITEEQRNADTTEPDVDDDDKSTLEITEEQRNVDTTEPDVDDDDDDVTPQYDVEADLPNSSQNTPTAADDTAETESKAEGGDGFSEGLDTLLDKSIMTSMTMGDVDYLLGKELL